MSEDKDIRAGLDGRGKDQFEINRGMGHATNTQETDTEEVMAAVEHHHVEMFLQSHFSRRPDFPEDAFRYFGFDNLRSGNQGGWRFEYQLHFLDRVSLVELLRDLLV